MADPKDKWENPPAPTPPPLPRKAQRPPPVPEDAKKKPKPDPDDLEITHVSIQYEDIKKEIEEAKRASENASETFKKLGAVPPEKAKKIVDKMSTLPPRPKKGDTDDA